MMIEITISNGVNEPSVDLMTEAEARELLAHPAYAATSKSMVKVAEGVPARTQTEFEIITAVAR